LIPHWARNALADLLVPRNILVSQLEVSTLEIPIAGLPVALDGFTIAHVSDLHVGSATHWIPRWAPEAADAVRRAKVDVVVNTGDFFWKDPPAAKARAYASLFIRADRGVDSHTVNFAILGNHDYYVPLETRRSLTDHLHDSGITVLTNEAVCLQRGSAGISLVGLTDEEDSFERGLAMLQTSARPRIALVHVPDLVEKIPRGAADLVLAGHTHGGQFTLPFLEQHIVRYGCGSNYVDGLNTINDMPVYINRGLGYTGFPVRFRARPEVALVRLVR
jgi:predicted MPP superfamily phosphohydrolase